MLLHAVMLGRPLVSLALLVFMPLLGIGCAPMTDDDIGEEMGESDSSLTAGITAGAKLVTTARLNLREGASTDETLIRTMASGDEVEAVSGAPTNGFYQVKHEGRTGWAHGKWLKLAGSRVSPAADDSSDDVANDETSPALSVESCKASFYFTGSRTANGEAFKPDGISAAHKTLAFGTKVRVTNKKNNKSVVVRINDRGPFKPGRCIDLSRGAARVVDMIDAGVVDVKVEVISRP